MPEQPNPILDLVAQYRAALENYDKKALSRLIDTYGRMYGRLQDKIDLLVTQIAEDMPTRGQLTRMRRYQELMTQIDDEMRGFQAILGDEVAIVGRDNIVFAGRDAQRMLQGVGEMYGVNVGFNRLPTDAVETLLGFLSPQGPLYERIGKLAGTYAQEVSDAIAEGVGLGYNPRKIAGLIRDKLGGGLTDALRMTRTVQLWSYREATRANYVNNADVIEGWIWHANLAGEPCMACIAMHGTFHTLDESLDDHHNGRCAMIPVVRGFPSPVDGTGEEWFKNLPEAKQRGLMGGQKYDAWQGGAFKFDELAAKRYNDVYGSMTTEKPLWELLGAEPPYTTK